MYTTYFQPIILIKLNDLPLGAATVEINAIAISENIHYQMQEYSQICLVLVGY